MGARRTGGTRRSSVDTPSSRMYVFGWLFWDILSQTEIDQARDREKSLAFHRTSTQFGEFMDKLLLEIGEYRKGGDDEPELVAADP